MPQSLSTLLPKEKAIPRTAQKREAGFWNQMRTALKKSSRKIASTRLETWATPGIPDVLLCDENGKFHFVELKATSGNAVDLRPHQVAWLSTHKNASVWVLVKKLQTKNAPEQIFLFHGRDAMDLKLEGLKVEPVIHQKEKFDWEDIFRLICP